MPDSAGSSISAGPPPIKQTAPSSTTPGEPAHTFLPGSTALRRTVVVLIAAVGVLALSPVVSRVAAWMGSERLTLQRSEWILAAAEIALGIYVWGVGSLSRYAPPKEGDLRRRGDHITGEP